VPCVQRRLAATSSGRTPVKRRSWTWEFATAKTRALPGRSSRTRRKRMENCPERSGHARLLPRLPQHRSGERPGPPAPRTPFLPQRRTAVESGRAPIQLEGQGPKTAWFSWMKPVAVFQGAQGVRRSCSSSATAALGASCGETNGCNRCEWLIGLRIGQDSFSKKCLRRALNWVCFAALNGPVTGKDRRQWT